MLDHVHESDEEYHSFSGNEPEDGEDDLDDEVADQPPAHPVQSMQAAFEESILESTEDAESTESSTKPDAESRRQKLLEQKYYDDSWTTRWKQKPGAQYHPLLKLMAQIVFGMHLLQQQQAKSDAEVVKILQTHVDEVDSFLEKTSEDFDLAIKDVEERVRFLKLPMTHLDVFDIMLDDKKFRTQLIDGNDKIEKIIDRSAKAMNAALLDVRRGKQATEELKVYLSQVRRGWPRDNRDLAAIYGAMRGNEEGWMKCLRDLKMKGNKLSEALVQLGTTIGEMSKLAAAASRRNKPSSRHGSVSSTGSLGGSVGPRSKFARDPPKSRFAPAAVDKPLPKEPDTVGPAVRATVLRSQPATRDHAIPFEQRFERPRRQPPTPTSPRSLAPETSSPRTTSPLPKRPATAGQMAPRDARTNHIRSETAELADFFRGGGGPLSSNPPDEVTTFASRPGSRGAEKTLARSTSRGADQALSRSRSRGAESALDQSKERDQNDSVGGQATGGAERSLSRSQSRDAKGTLSPPHSPTLRKDSVARYVCLPLYYGAFH